MYKLVHTHTKLKISFSTIFSTCVKNTELIYIYIYIYISKHDLKTQGSQ